jgi:putative RNA 2'-phosphotransferase
VLRACESHGYFEGETCPECSAEGRHVLDGSRRTRLSKFVSGALRHFPDDAGIPVDERGWTEYVRALAEVV